MTDEFILGFSKFWVDRILGSHFFMIIGIVSDIWLYDSLVFIYESYDYCIVEFSYFFFCYFLLERLHRSTIFRYDDESTRISIEPMDQSWAFDTIDIALFSVVIEDRIEKGSSFTIYPRISMCIDTSLFVDDHKIRIIRNNLERYIFSIEVIFFSFTLDLDQISESESFTILYGFSIYQNTSALYELIDIELRKIWKYMGKIEIESSFILWIYIYRKLNISHYFLSFMWIS